MADCSPLRTFRRSALFSRFFLRIPPPVASKSPLIVLRHCPLSSRCLTPSEFATCFTGRILITSLPSDVLMTPEIVPFLFTFDFCIVFAFDTVVSVPSSGAVCLFSGFYEILSRPPRRLRLQICEELFLLSSSLLLFVLFYRTLRLAVLLVFFPRLR